MFIPLGTIVPMDIRNIIFLCRRILEIFCSYALMFIPLGTIVPKDIRNIIFLCRRILEIFCSYALMFIPLGTIVPNSLIHSDSRTLRASLLLLKTFSMAVMDMWLALCPGNVKCLPVG